MQLTITKILEEEMSSPESENSSTEGEDDHEPSSDAESSMSMYTLFATVFIDFGF